MFYTTRAKSTYFPRGETNAFNDAREYVEPRSNSGPSFVGGPRVEAEHILTRSVAFNGWSILLHCDVEPRRVGVELRTRVAKRGDRRLATYRGRD